MHAALDSESAPRPAAAGHLSGRWLVATRTGISVGDSEWYASSVIASLRFQVQIHVSEIRPHQDVVLCFFQAAIAGLIWQGL